jgi:hypothetical protein
VNEHKEESESEEKKTEEQISEKKARARKNYFRGEIVAVRFRHLTFLPHSKGGLTPTFPDAPSGREIL